jgi:hypothetical protein
MGFNREMTQSQNRQIVSSSLDTIADKHLI